ncbi:unnamed protein product, partial [Allacma fusca]
MEPVEKNRRVSDSSEPRRVSNTPEKRRASGQNDRKESLDTGPQNARKVSTNAPKENNFFKRTTSLAEVISDGPSARRDSNYEDDGDQDSDPVLVAKRNQATMKNVLAAGAEAAIKRAVNNLEKGQNRTRLQCTSIFILATVLCLVGVCHVFLLSMEFGHPPTLEAHSASSVSMPVFLLTAILATSAFVILYLKLTHLIIGLTWMLLLIMMEYMLTIIIAKSAYTLHKATFEDIKIYSKHHYALHQSIPKYVSYYEEKGNCCGWDDPDRKFAAWPELLESNDLPDSCCIEQFYGCGKSAVARGVPSGHIMALSANEYGKFLQAYAGDIDTNLWFDPDNLFSKVLRNFPPWKGIPDDLLRYVDEARDIPLYYYMGDDVSNPAEPVSYIYKSYGQAENYRMKETIKEKTCDPEIVLKATKDHTIYILLYSSMILLVCFIEAVVFWYYFVEERAELLGRNRQPGEFMLLQMERICIDD